MKKGLAYLSLGAVLSLAGGIVLAGANLKQNVVHAEDPATKTIYFNANIWNGSDSPKYAAWSWNESKTDSSWVMGNQYNGNVFTFEVPFDRVGFDFLRMGQDMDLGWNKNVNYWNRTDDEYPAEHNNFFTITTWDQSPNGNSTGTWTNYGAFFFAQSIRNAEDTLTNPSDPSGSCLAKYNAVKAEYEALDADSIAVMESQFNSDYVMFKRWASAAGVSLANAITRQVDDKNSSTPLVISIVVASTVLAIGVLMGLRRYYISK